MKALMIAAGRGSGFNGRGPASHKTLAPVWGLTVIERIVAAIPELEELVVVTGFRHEKLEADLTRLLAGRLLVTFVFNPEWERANGVSVLAARKDLAGESRFILTMSDHVFEPALAERLLASPPGRGECVLAVDQNLGRVFDIADATKVKLSADGRIRQIGKSLIDFEAADTGVFYCTPALFSALDKAITSGSGESLSDGIRILCEAGRMRSADVTGCMWQDVDNLESLAEAKKRVWKNAQKPHDGVVSRLFNRKVSGFITRRIAHLGVKPNHVTFFNLLLAGLAGWLMAAGHLVAGALLAQLYSITDGVDGELSRLKLQGSWFGAWLDNLTDRLCDWAIIAGAAWSLTAVGHASSTAWIILGLALLSDMVYRTAMDSLLVSGALRQGGGPPGFLGRIEDWFLEREMVFGVTHDSYLFLLAAAETLWWCAKTWQAARTLPSEHYEFFLANRRIEKDDDRKSRIPEFAAR